MNRGLVLLIFGLAAGCSQPDVDLRAREPITPAGAAYDDANAEHPRLTFLGGKSTPNDRCIVTQRKLNPHLPPVWVNGVPIGFC